MKYFKKTTLKVVGYIFTLLFCILIFTFMNTHDDSIISNELTSKEVIEKYFYYYNARSKRKILTTMTPWHKESKNSQFGFKHLEYIKIIHIEDEDFIQRDAYMNYGNGRINGVNKENVKVHKVWFESKYNKPNPPWSSGSDWKYFVLIREDESSPWLIDESGE